MLSAHGQSAHRLRFDWGLRGAEALTDDADVGRGPQRCGVRSGVGSMLWLPSPTTWRQWWPGFGLPLAMLAS